MSLVHRVPHEVSELVLPTVKLVGPCRAWTGALDRFGCPFFRTQSLGRWLYLSPKVAVFEVEVNCNLLRGFSVSASCKNKLCCDPKCMTIVPVYNSKCRVYMSGVGVVVPRFGQVAPVITKKQCSSMGGDMSSGIPGALTDGYLSASEIADKFNVSVVHVKRLAAANRLNWF